MNSLRQHILPISTALGIMIRRIRNNIPPDSETADAGGSLPAWCGKQPSLAGDETNTQAYKF